MNYMQAMRAKRDRINWMLHRMFIHTFIAWVLICLIAALTACSSSYPVESKGQYSRVVPGIQKFHDGEVTCYVSITDSISCLKDTTNGR